MIARPVARLPRRLPGVLRLLPAALALFALSGCVYYNTFYLARKYYRTALTEQKKDVTGKLVPSAKTNFDKSVAQCSKVLQRHAKSSWADDALLLMGQAYYGSQQYSQARRWLGEMPTSYPKSKLIPDAQYWIARSYLAEENYDRARAAFEEILQAYPDCRLADEITFDLAETQFRQGDFAGAVEKYQAFLDRYPKSLHQVESLLRIGDARLERRQYAEAMESYQKAVLRSRDPKDRLEARLKLGRVLEQQGKYADALESYRNLAFELLDRAKLNQLMSGADQTKASNLATPGTAGQPLETRIDPETGTTITLNPNFQRDAAGNIITGTNSSQDEDPDAGRQPGIGVTGSAIASTAPAAPDGRVPLEGTSASRQVAAAAVVSNPLAIELPRVLLRQGLCLSQLGDDKEAIAVFRAILAAWPRTSEAAEAQFRVGYIQEVNQEDYEAARKSYDAVSQQGPSIFAEQAKRRASGVARLAGTQATGSDGKPAAGKGAAPGAPAAKAPLSDAEKDFLAAELYYFQQDKPEKALEQYARVESLYTDSRFAPKAALARAWILVNAMSDSTAGLAAYQHVLDGYPKTEEFGLAYMILKGEPPTPDLLPAPADSTAPAGEAAGAGTQLAAETPPPGGPGTQPPAEAPPPGGPGAPAPGSPTSAAAVVATPADSTRGPRNAKEAPPPLPVSGPTSRLAPADSKGLPRPVAGRPGWAQPGSPAEKASSPGGKVPAPTDKAKSPAGKPAASTAIPTTPSGQPRQPSNAPDKNRRGGS